MLGLASHKFDRTRCSLLDCTSSCHSAPGGRIFCILLLSGISASPGADCCHRGVLERPAEWQGQCPQPGSPSLLCARHGRGHMQRWLRGKLKIFFNLYSCCGNCGTMLAQKFNVPTSDSMCAEAHVNVVQYTGGETDP